jgi:hypothetical protein
MDRLSGVGLVTAIISGALLWRPLLVGVLHDA